MEQEYPVPDFEHYSVTEDGKIISKLRNKPKVLKQKEASSNCRQRKQVSMHQERGGKRFYKISSRVIAAAKYHRWPKSWEQVRHMNGDRDDNSMHNLVISDALNNLIDDIENGTRETNAEYLDVAIARLMDLRADLE